MVIMEVACVGTWLCEAMKVIMEGVGGYKQRRQHRGHSTTHAAHDVDRVTPPKDDRIRVGLKQNKHTWTCHAHCDNNVMLLPELTV